MTISHAFEGYEIVLVCDNSPDQSWDIILTKAQANKHIIGLRLSRNFGQHQAIAAGLSKSTGDFIVIMDCDLQDPPSEINTMFNHLINNELDYVQGQRLRRQDGFIKKHVSKLFYKIFSFMLGEELDHTRSNFGVYKKSVIDAINEMPEFFRFFPALLSWVGFRGGVCAIKHNARIGDESSYTFFSLLNLGITTILSFSNRPLRLLSQFGLIVSVSAFIYGFYLFYYSLYHSIPVTGWSSLIVSIWIQFGIIVFSIGLVGEYLGIVFEQVKNRPKFIIAEEVQLINEE